jgi:hypothetical protein
MLPFLAARRAGKEAAVDGESVVRDPLEAGVAEPARSEICSPMGFPAALNLEFVDHRRVHFQLNLPYV